MEDRELTVLKAEDKFDQVMLHQRAHLTSRAEFAKDLARNLALAAVPDGEDSVGRQSHRMLTADEAAARACEFANALFDEFEKRKWLIAAPPFAQLLRESTSPGFTPRKTA